MGGGGSGAGAGLGGRGAAASARGAMAAHGDTLANHGAHEGALHGANAIAGKHAAGEHEHATSKLAATDRHHHPYRREPHYGRNTFPQYFESCKRIPDPFYPWLNCYGPTKSAAGSKGHS
jgi:hypothetical protein